MAEERTGEAVEDPVSNERQTDLSKLRLLVALDALLRENSVSRAASSVGLQPSAMSRLLGQLREDYADPLFLQICVRPREQSVRALHAQLQAHGQFAVDYAPLDDGQEYLRLVVHPRTPWHVYEQLLAYLGEGRSY